MVLSYGQSRSWCCLIDNQGHGAILLTVQVVVLSWGQSRSWCYLISLSVGSATRWMNSSWMGHVNQLRQKSSHMVKRGHILSLNSNTASRWRRLWLVNESTDVHRANVQTARVVNTITYSPSTNCFLLQLFWGQGVGKIMVLSYWQCGSWCYLKDSPGHGTMARTVQVTLPWQGQSRSRYHDKDSPGHGTMTRTAQVTVPWQGQLRSRYHHKDSSGHGTIARTAQVMVTSQGQPRSQYHHKDSPQVLVLSMDSPVRKEVPMSW